jgi:hypothetical protein
VRGSKSIRIMTRWSVGWLTSVEHAVAKTRRSPTWSSTRSYRGRVWDHWVAFEGRGTSLAGVRNGGAGEPVHDAVTSEADTADEAREGPDPVVRLAFCLAGPRRVPFHQPARWLRLSPAHRSMRSHGPSRFAKPRP